MCEIGLSTLRQMCQISLSKVHQMCDIGLSTLCQMCEISLSTLRQMCEVATCTRRIRFSSGSIILNLSAWISSSTMQRGRNNLSRSYTNNAVKQWTSKPAPVARTPYILNHHFIIHNHEPRNSENHLVHTVSQISNRSYELFSCLLIYIISSILCIIQLMLQYEINHSVLFLTSDLRTCT